MWEYIFEQLILRFFENVKTDNFIWHNFRFFIHVNRKLFLASGVLGSRILYIWDLGNF